MDGTGGGQPYDFPTAFSRNSLHHCDFKINKSIKKLVTAACALAAGFAMADGVESANIVGYQQITLTDKNTILGINFESVDGKALTINEAVPYAEGMTTAAVYSDADQIQIQNAEGGYDIYFISNGKNAKGKDVAGLANKWAKGGTTAVAETEMPAGTAFWFVRKDTTEPITITVAGGVSMLGSNNIGIDGTYKLITNPYPTDLPLNDGVSYVEGMTTAAVYSDADQIQIQNAEGGYDIYFISNGKNAKGKDVAGLANKWAKGGTTAVTDAALPSGKGAWFVRKGDKDFDIAITRPYAIE